jgi:hypothetical protein
MFEAGHIDAASLPEIIKLKSLFTENKESIAILHTASKTWPIQALAA